MSDLVFTGLETAEERLAICQRDSMAKREVIQRLKAEAEQIRAALRELLAGSAKDDPHVKVALDRLLTTLAGEGDDA